MSRRSQVGAVLGGAVLVLAACSAGPTTSTTGQGENPSPAPGNLTPGSREDTQSALDDMRDPSFPPPLIDPDLVLSGGPPPDGIPPLDDPQFERADTVDWLGDREPVLSLTVGGETRGYPIQVMTWHEIVNDTVGGTPVAVTYCPLCNSGVAFEREAAGRLLSFGTSGRLYADNLVMYDRQTETLWPQLTGQASIGVLTGEQLTAIPMGAVDWATFRDADPDALVLSRDTGFDRPYGRNPYVGYDDPASPPLFDLPGQQDPRLTAKTRVVGVDLAGQTIAIPRARLAADRVVELSVSGEPLVLFHTPGQSSALGDEQIADGADIGTVAVFRATQDGVRLRFTATEDGFVDDRAGTRWDILGRATDGPSAGETLEPVRFLDTFWFAWVAFHPDTELRE